METLGREMKGIGLNCAVLLLNETKQVAYLHYVSVSQDVLALVEQQTGLNFPGMQITYHEAAELEDGRERPASPPGRDRAPILKGRATRASYHQAIFYSDILLYLARLFQEAPKEEVARAVRLVGIPPFTPIILLPLQLRDRFLGDLAVWGHGLHEGDIKPLSVFANQLAGAIDKSILLDTIQRRVQETDTLREAAAIVTSALDLDQVLDRILTQLERVIPYDQATIFLFEGQALTITACRGFQDPGQVLGQVFPADNPLFLEALHRQAPLSLVDAQQDDRFQGWCGTTYTRGWMGAPLIVRNESIGYLILDSRQAGAYGPEKEALIGAFANQAAIAIENARLFKQAQHLAITDSLTGLYNRRHFFDLASREFERTRRYGHALALLMWDIDHFKTVNDRFGHIAGDQVLQAVTQRCRAQLREVDIMGRYGGEEFVAILPETGLDQARLAAGRLCQAISNEPFSIGRESVFLSISLGVAEADEACSSLEILLDRADQALYTAKQGGRNGVAAWTNPP
jgi:diguanylate cyclase (GGDEF)-like protein